MQDRLFIDGAWESPIRGGRIAVVNPATEEKVADVAAGTREDVDRAVAAARRTFDQGAWSKESGRERAKVLHAIAQGIRGRREALAQLEVVDNGKPLAEALCDIDDAATCFEFYAKLAEELDASRTETVQVGDARFVSKATREPVGVAAAIIPWNFPLLMAAWKVAPALAAGCTMVLKPSEWTPLTALELGSIAKEAGLAPGVLNIVPGFGNEAGKALAQHPLVDKVAFTGSVPVGAGVMSMAADDIKRVSLELGGKSPFLIFDDADCEKAVEWIMVGIFFNQGQVCSATSRVLVQRGVYKRVLDRLVEEAAKIKIGNGMDPDTKLGPLVCESQYNKVMSYLGEARAAGATIATGGGRPAGPTKGYFIQPTVMTDVRSDSRAWLEEIFGPVVCVAPFDTEEEAVRRANDTKYGLAGAVMSADSERCERVAAALRAGVVWINCSQPTFVEAPWGGYKRSGIGRELGKWGLDNYLETKQITRLVSEDPWGWYIQSAR
jgi:betaine-aldehyde dehydrogenase